MHTMRILLAGSTGAIGREIAALLQRDGHTLQCPTRSAGVDALQPDTLRGLCKGVEVVVSAMGGSVSLSASERRPYAFTNTVANENLIAEACRAGVRRLVYVAAHKGPGYDETAYIRSHEAVVERLASASLGYTVVRPTGVFTALAPLADFARRGFVPLLGDGSARTNPIHAADVARAVVEHLRDGPLDVSIGGPDVLTRRGIAALAATGLRPRFVSIPAPVARFHARLAGLLNPRLGELMAFAAAVSVVDCVAPAYGHERLADYFHSRRV
ncbi:MAG: NAD-dependent epimerase/dehydratase family protein [Acidimicrobiia bacterium]|nr:NAD-dependent epimerase/dehydratase family protein [Acidimicrobiia bacterium]